MNEQKLTVPISIIIAGIFIAGAILLGTDSESNPIVPVPTDNQKGQEVIQQGNPTDAVNPVTAEDHIKGDLNALITIVEYSDFECPFCKRFHGTMNQIMDEYGQEGQVAWVYRQFPLDQLHPVKARYEALASECVAELGGNDKFWSFTDRFFELTPSNNRTDIDTVIPQIVREIGLDEGAFNECMESGRQEDSVQEDIENAIATGGNGTPWSVVIGPDGKTYPLSGAQPFEAIKQLIGIALNSK